MSLLSKLNNVALEQREVVRSNAVQSKSMQCWYVIKDNTWIIDSGATDHVCYNLALFDKYKPLTKRNHSVTISNGDQIKVNIIGDVIVHDNFISWRIYYMSQVFIITWNLLTCWSKTWIVN